MLTDSYSRQATSTKWQAFANRGSNAQGVTRCAGTPRRNRQSPKVADRTVAQTAQRHIGIEMGAKKCYATHKVIQPWAADTVSLRELPICESLTEDDGSAAQTIHPGVKPLPPAPSTQSCDELSKADDRKRADDGKSSCYQRTFGDLSAPDEGQGCREFFQSLKPRSKLAKTSKRRNCQLFPFRLLSH